MIEALPIILPVALIIGFIDSFIPNIAGAAALFHLGKRHRWTRSPLVWAMSGGALGVAVGALLDIGGSGHAGSLVCGLVGIPCALICRARTRWAD